VRQEKETRSVADLKAGLTGFAHFWRPGGDRRTVSEINVLGPAGSSFSFFGQSYLCRFVARLIAIANQPDSKTYDIYWRRCHERTPRCAARIPRWEFRRVLTLTLRRRAALRSFPHTIDAAIGRAGVSPAVSAR